MQQLEDRCALIAFCWNASSRRSGRGSPDVGWPHLGSEVHLMQPEANRRRLPDLSLVSPERSFKEGKCDNSDDIFKMLLAES